MPDLFRYLEVIARVTGSAAGTAAQTDDELGARMFELQPQTWHAGTPTAGLRAIPFHYSIASGGAATLFALTDPTGSYVLPRWLIFTVNDGGLGTGVKLRINSNAGTGTDVQDLRLVPGNGRGEDVVVLPIRTAADATVNTPGYTFLNDTANGVTVRGIFLYEPSVSAPSPG